MTGIPCELPGRSNMDANLPITTFAEDAEFISALSNEDIEIRLDRSLESCPDLDSAWDDLTRCLRLHRKAEALAMRLRPIIGRTLIWAHYHPEFFKSKGFKSYEQFLQKHVCKVIGLKRSRLLEIRRTMERLKTMTSDLYEELGPTKVHALAKITSSDDSTYLPYLEKARTMTAVAFEDWAISKGLVEEGELQQAVIIIRSNKTVQKLWDEFKEIPEIHSHCGSDVPYQIFNKMIQESWSWILDGKYRMTCPHCNKDFIA